MLLSTTRQLQGPHVQGLKACRRFVQLRPVQFKLDKECSNECSDDKLGSRLVHIPTPRLKLLLGSCSFYSNSYCVYIAISFFLRQLQKTYYVFSWLSMCTL